MIVFSLLIQTTYLAESLNIFNTNTNANTTINTIYEDTNSDLMY